MKKPTAVGDGLVIDDVGHSFGKVKALSHVSLSVDPGQVHCLLGPSGSGKSTLLRLIAGLETLQSGRIQIGTTTVADESYDIAPEKRAIGFVFQDYALFPHLNVAQNVGFGITGKASVRRDATVESLLDRLEMGAFASAMPHTLSGGQQQRVALARALARQPRVMLMDEPFSGLDANLRDEVRDRTLDVLRQQGVATLLVTHSPEEALAVGDQISVLISGERLQTGNALDVYGRPSSLEVGTIFGPINTLAGQVEGAKVLTPCGPLEAEAHPQGHGRQLDVLVRPEALRLRPPSEGHGSPGTVRSVIPSGAIVSIHIDLDSGVAIQACELSPSEWKIGDAVRVSIRPEAPVSLLPRNE